MLAWIKSIFTWLFGSENADIFIKAGVSIALKGRPKLAQKVSGICNDVVKGADFSSTSSVTSFFYQKMHDYAFTPEEVLAMGIIVDRINKKIKEVPTVQMPDELKTYIGWVKEVADEYAKL